MKIEIGEKIRPFSHVPGIRCVVPGSSLVIQAFPTLIRIEGFPDIPIELTGPVKDFTLQLDLEKHCLWIWGAAKEGYYKFKLESSADGLSLCVDRAPKEGLKVGDKIFARKEKALLLSAGQHRTIDRVERLSLGNFKVQNWDVVWRRMDLKEIVPALFMLGQMTPPIAGETLLKGPLDLFLCAAFSDLLVPRLRDEQFQGIAHEGTATGDPMAILYKSYLQIRSYLLEIANPAMRILPNLPAKWDAGRATNLHVEGLGDFDLEWSRSQIRRMVFRATRTGGAIFSFASPVSSYRMNRMRRGNGDLLAFEELGVYEFDQFQK